MTKVKICGITNLEDALLSAKFGADALGFNFYKKSPRYIEPEKAREIIDQLPDTILKVGVFVNETLETVAEITQTANLNAIQLHGEETPEFCREIKLKTNLEIIKAFRVSPEFVPEDVLKYEVDAILLDAYNPKEHGGTGETFDWDIAKKVQEIFPKMYLAGGLNNENIGIAIGDVKPFAVDACSGIESEKGKKDDDEVDEFIRQIGNYNFMEEKFDWNLTRAVLKTKNDFVITHEWEATIDAFEKRISKRYFQTIKYLTQRTGKSIGEGFPILTLECSLIEYLATLKDGMIFKYNTEPKQKTYYYSKSVKWYKKFLDSADIFEGYFHGEGKFLDSNDFYLYVRCALIHEAQTRNGWTVNIFNQDKTKDGINQILFENKKIYRTALNKALETFFKNFCNEARHKNKTGKKYRKFIARKFDVIHEIEPDNAFWW